MKPVGLVSKFHKCISIKNSALPSNVTGDMLEALELSESVNSADPVTFIVLYLGLCTTD
jgi:hypothetical protein